ncbi:MAG: trypsin-like serine protease [Candidatus Nitronauta litoralis]|uniref:Trypsin-like serine protease n=1 Tax=Candidatus Nitronauta litoralis TaxID=2705533 RepID=A0A7T0BYN4_9BACT|nr:MAG: trypsin-like serine protease [Candidatus Nitronauta litoralis]
MKKFVLIAFFFLIFSSVLINYQGYQIKIPDIIPASTGHLATTIPKNYNDLLSLQKAFIRNARQLRPSVISINNLKELKRSPHSNLKPGENFLNRFKDFLDKTFRKHYQMESLGSGILLTNNGYILTNYHVVEETDKILVKLSDGEEYNAKIIGLDPKTDLAVLKIFSLTGFDPAPLGRSDDLKVGEWVMAIGNPYGLEGTVTVGVVSGIHRSDLGITTFENFIQTDASINPGNSGGPLINLDGQVVGINTAVAEIGAGVGFAIPIQMAVKIAEEIIEKGEVSRGWLGVGIQELTPELAESFQVAIDKGGVVVNSVETGAPADQGGLKRGDIIVSYAGEQVSDLKELQRMVAESNIGEEIPVQILRNGQAQQKKITIGKMIS